MDRWTDAAISGVICIIAKSSNRILHSSIRAVKPSVQKTAFFLKWTYMAAIFGGLLDP
jgi:hypothetical protein